MQSLDNLSFKLKLALMPALVVVVLLISAGMVLRGSTQLGSALQALYTQRLPSYAFAAKLEADLRHLDGLIHQSIALQAVGAGGSEVAAIDQAIATDGERVQKTLEARAATADAKERDQLAALAASLQTYRRTLADIVERKRANLATASTSLATAHTQSTQLLQSATAMSARELERAGQQVERAQARGVRMRWLTALVAGAMAVFALFAGAAIARGLLQRVGRLSRAMAALGDGDLTRPIMREGRDEVGQLMEDAEAVRQRLSESMRSVHEASESVRSAAAEIANGNLSLGQRTDSASSSLQQTSASMQQLTGAVNDNARASERASDTASSAANAARATGEVVERMVETMAGISTASKRIAEITSVIDGIAFQTNILALNAAVEAARAGDQGRGFAVVAGEVRSLAQRASSASKEIAGLVRASTTSVKAGEQLVGQAGGSIESLVDEVAAVAELLTGIRSATLQQSSEIAQINSVLTSLDSATLQNAALVEESTAAAVSLREQSDSLAGILARFRVSA